MSAPRDMVFSVLFIGDQTLLRELVLNSMSRLGAEWNVETVCALGIQRLRVLFFLLMDRDLALKEKLLDGWREMCVPGLDAGKAERFFMQLRPEIIDPWLIDERKTDDEFVNAVKDLYLVS
jgi:hypothetical protein